RQHPFKRFLGSQFAAGLVAGLLMATLVLSILDQKRRIPATETRLATDPKVNELFTPGRLGPEPSQLVQWPGQPDVQYHRDGYIITDDQGNQWLVEGMREDTVRTPFPRADH
ncbi:hypothetical protein ACFL6U_19945, partial [Planctomycetota bacterium]